MKILARFTGNSTGRTILLVVLVFGALAVLLMIPLAGQDWYVLVALYLSSAALLIMAWVVLRGSRLFVPEGMAVVVNKGGFARAFTGPAEVTYSRFRDQVTWHAVRQKLADLPCECNTKDHFTIKLNLTIIWDAQAGSLPDIIAGRVNVPDLFVRLAQARLLFECVRYDLEELQQVAPLVAERVRDFLNQPQNRESLYLVKSVLITSIKLPPEVTAASIRLMELQTDRTIAKAKREMAFKDHLAESKAHAVELEVLDSALRQVDPRTVEHHQAETTSHARPEV
jgi:hypothetical protein